MAGIETTPSALLTLPITLAYSYGTGLALYITDISAANPKAADNGGKKMRSELMTNDLGVAVVNSRRVQDGVEIIEREVHLVTTFDVPAAQPAAPKLVVTDALTSAAESIIAKTRAEVEGLNALLQSFALGTPALK